MAKKLPTKGSVKDILYWGISSMLLERDSQIGNKNLDDKTCTINNFDQYF